MNIENNCIIGSYEVKSRKGMFFDDAPEVAVEFTVEPIVEEEAEAQYKLKQN